MTKKSSKTPTVNCPKCGNVIPFEATSNLQPDSTEFSQLMRGTLNVCTCPECNAKFRISTPLTYSDAERGFFLVQTDFPEDGNTENLENEIDATMTDAAMSLEIARPIIRLVYTREEFIEKIMLVNAGFDDRLMEYAKFQLFQSCPGQLDHEKHRLLFDFSNKDDNLIKFVVFDKENGKHIAGLHIERKDYEAMDNEFKNTPTLQKELDALFPNCNVTVDRVFDF